MYRGHSSSVRLWLTSLDGGGGVTSRTRVTHVAEGNSPEKRPAVSPLQPSRKGANKVYLLHGVSGDEHRPSGKAEAIKIPVIYWY